MNRSIASRSLVRFLRRRTVTITAGVVFSVALLGSTSSASASVAYNLVNYPVNQYDELTRSPDTVSGTIVTDGYIGSWIDGSHLVAGGTLTFEGSRGSFTYIIPPEQNYFISGFYTTANQILVRSGDLATIYATPDGLAAPAYRQIQLDYNRQITPQGYVGFVGDESYPYGGPHIMEFLAVNLPDGLTGSISTNDPWVVATAVPEPSTLFVWSLLGVCGLAYGWWWKWKVA